MICNKALNRRDKQFRPVATTKLRSFYPERVTEHYRPTRDRRHGESREEFKYKVDSSNCQL